MTTKVKPKRRKTESVKNDPGVVPCTQTVQSKQSFFDKIKDFAEPIGAVLAAISAIAMFGWKIIVYLCDAAYLVSFGIYIADIPMFSPQKVLIIICILFFLTWECAVVYFVVAPKRYFATSIMVVCGAIEITLLCLYSLHVFGLLPLFGLLKDPAETIRHLGMRVALVSLFLLILNINIRILGCDDKLQNALQGSLATIVIGCLAILMVASRNHGKNEKFSVVIEEGNPYVIIHTMEDNVIMLGCELDEDRTTVVDILKNKQKIVSIDGLEYEIMAYAPKTEEVIPKPTEAESITEEPTE